MGARKEANKVTELKGQGGEKMMCVSVRSSYSKLIETLKNCVFVFGRNGVFLWAGSVSLQILEREAPVTQPLCVVTAASHL